ncbi:MAG: XRE family transcriptional regulator [Alphaproteobacteria bacterium]|nr:XRE family transcriptional regulator [Alphaproteobacteria bacterium]
MKADIDPMTFTTFLIDAHRNTYADRNAVKAPSSRLRSTDYRFGRGDLAYHDTYFGVRDFIGEEIVYLHDLPLWGMNYFGVVLVDDCAEHEVYGFLREALQQDCVDIVPARGPCDYRRDGWAYSNAVDGVLGDFTGAELIYRGDVPVYRCRYHGGWLR